MPCKKKNTILISIYFYIFRSLSYLLLPDILQQLGMTHDEFVNFHGNVNLVSTPWIQLANQLNDLSLTSECPWLPSDSVGLNQYVELVRLDDNLRNILGLSTETLGEGSESSTADNHQGEIRCGHGVLPVCRISEEHLSSRKELNVDTKCAEIKTTTISTRNPVSTDIDINGRLSPSYLNVSNTIRGESSATGTSQVKDAESKEHYGHCISNSTDTVSQRSIPSESDKAFSVVSTRELVPPAKVAPSVFERTNIFEVVSPPQGYLMHQTSFPQKPLVPRVHQYEAYPPTTDISYERYSFQPQHVLDRNVFRSVEESLGGNFASVSREFQKERLSPQDLSVKYPALTGEFLRERPGPIPQDFSIKYPVLADSLHERYPVVQEDICGKYSAPKSPKAPERTNMIGALYHNHNSFTRPLPEIQQGLNLNPTKYPALRETLQSNGLKNQDCLRNSQSESRPENDIMNSVYNTNEESYAIKIGTTPEDCLASLPSPQTDSFQKKVEGKTRESESELLPVESGEFLDLEEDSDAGKQSDLQMVPPSCDPTPPGYKTL